MTTDTPVADWIDPAALFADPYPSYSRLRRESPVAWVPMIGAYVLSRYESSKLMEMNPDIFTAEAGMTTMRRTMNRSSMIDVNDPQHSLERSPVNAILRQKAIKQTGRRRSSRTPVTTSTAWPRSGSTGPTSTRRWRHA
jgi:cytochrome P450